MTIVSCERRATNTLIITGLPLEKLDDKENVDSIHQELIANISVSDIIQFIILRGLRRIVIIFQTVELASKILNIFRASHDDFRVTYTFQNCSMDISDNYLKLPDNSRMFLISPPASPPVDFDYDQVEEEPNRSQVYSPEDLHRIFLQNNKELRDLLESNLQSTEYTKDALKQIEKFEKEIVLSDSHDDSKPKIVLYPVVGDNDQLIGKAIRSFKTSLPPISIFDELSDREYSDDDEYD